MTRAARCSRHGSTPPIALERLRELIAYDPDTGLLTWRRAVSAKSHVVPGQHVGYVVFGRRYLRATVGLRHYPYHRLVWFHYYGSWPTAFIDHIDGDPGNNRIANLRDVSMRINTQNKKKPATRSGLLGAHTGGKGHSAFQSSIKTDGRSVYLGRFDTAEEAHATYIAAKKALHEGYVP